MSGLYFDRSQTEKHVLSSDGILVEWGFGGVSKSENLKNG